MHEADGVREAPGLSTAVRFYSVLLLAYPSDFRRQYGDEARGLFRDRYREEFRSAGWMGILRYGFRTLGNVFVNGPLEHWSNKRPRNANRSPRKGDGFMSRVVSDVRYSLRALRRSPGFTAAAVLALALGIGANTAIFSLINGVLLDSLPYGDAETLMVIRGEAIAVEGTPATGVSVGDLLDWRAANDSFTGIATHRNASLGFTGLERPVVPLTNEITTNYFDVLGVEPLMGRTFQDGDDVAGNRVVIVSYGVWQTALGGDPEIVGKDIELDQQNWRVLGVLKPDFYVTNAVAVQPGLWIPLVVDGAEDDRRMRSMLAFGRLKEGVTLQQAYDNMRAVSAATAEEYPDTNTGFSAEVLSIRERVFGNVQDVFLLLLAAVGFVLLIACANVANLILARSAERQREVALRVALGASRGRLVQQLMTESVVLAVIAGAVASVVSVWGIRPLVTMIPSTTGLPFLDQVSVDGTVLAFSFALAVVTGVLCGIAPAAQLSRSDLAATIKSEGRSHTAGKGGRRLRNGLVVAEFALSLILLVGAGLMLQTFMGLRNYTPGFDAEQILHLRTSTRGEYFNSMEATKNYFAELSRRLETIPGVEKVSAASVAPPTTRFQMSPFQIVGRLAEPGQEPMAADRRVLPDYFDTMGINLVKGRVFDSGDSAEGAPVAVANQAFADRYFAGDEMEQMAVSMMGDQEPRRIVGIVANVRAAGTDPTPLPVLYSPSDQRPLSAMSFVVRTAGDPALLAREAEDTAWSMGPDMNVYQVQPMAERLDNDSWRERFIAQLIGLFALLALVLGAAGIYSVLTYAVTQRTQEIGVRLALGARRSNVVGMVVADGVKLALIGAAIGTLGALGLSRVISGLLYDVSATDPVTFAMVTGVLMLVAIAACLVPALRATRVDPMVALRSS